MLCVSYQLQPREMRESTNFLELLAIEEVTQQLLNSRDTSGTTNKHDLVDLGLVDIGILQYLPYRVQGTRKRFGVQIFESGASDLSVEIFTIKQRIDLNSGLGPIGQRSLGPLACSS